MLFGYYDTNGDRKNFKFGAYQVVHIECPSILPEVSGYHTWAMMWRKPLSLFLHHTYLDVVGSNPMPGKTFLAQNSIAGIKG